MTRADPPRLRAAVCAALAIGLAATPALAQWRDRPGGGPRESRGQAAQDRERAPRAAPGWGARGYGGYDGVPRYAAPRYAVRPYQGQAYPGQAYQSQPYRPPELRGQELRGPELRAQAFRGQAYPGGGGPYGGYGVGRPLEGEGRAWRRGQVLPDGYRGATVPDPGRYHLRRAPNGYDWVGDGRNAYLMQRSTGMVLDSVPGAYDPPPPYPGRRRR